MSSRLEIKIRNTEIPKGEPNPLSSPPWLISEHIKRVLVKICAKKKVARCTGLVGAIKKWVMGRKDKRLRYK